MNILIAEDEYFQALIIEKQLKLIKDDLIIYFAKNGREACEIVSKNCPELIIMDMQMPEMDGIEATIEIRKKYISHELPIIMLTKESSKIELEKAFNAGINDYIRKPVEILEFRARIKSVIALSETFKTLKQQKNIIEENSISILNQNRLLNDSLKYAKQLQNSSLGSDKVIFNLFPNSFICFNPKDVIGGDFYWFFENVDYKFVVVSDCTGHGVPGALISILGVTLLKEIVITNKIFDPADILTQLNKKVIDAFIDKHNGLTIDGGMDMSICRFDKDNNVVLSSANQTIYIVHNDELVEYEGSIFNINGDLSNSIDVKFENNTVKLQSNDFIFMTTDGFKDQLGGGNLKKIGSERLNNLILDNYKLDIQEQKNNFLNFLSNWQGEVKQTDDILFLGIKIKL